MFGTFTHSRTAASSVAEIMIQFAAEISDQNLLFRLSATRSIKHFLGCASDVQTPSVEVDMDRRGLVLTWSVRAGLVDC
jgi:hypothetical protein